MPMIRMEFDSDNILKDRKILETCSYGKDKWYIPGGKRAVGESERLWFRGT